MFTVEILIHWPDGSTTTDRATGNSKRDAQWKAFDLAREYERKGCTCERADY